MKKILLMLMILLLFAVNVHAENIFINEKAIGLNTGKTPKDAFIAFPVTGEVLIAEDTDSLYVSPGIYKGFIARASVTVKNNGIGTVAIIPATTTGATFCILQQCKLLTLDGITLDNSQANSAASHFGLRREWYENAITIIKNNEVSGPPLKNYDDNYTSRKQMTFKHLDLGDMEYKNTLVADTKFFSVVGDKPSFMESVDQDSTLVTSKLTLSATAVIGVEVRK